MISNNCLLFIITIHTFNDTHGTFNPTTHLYVVPVSGWYFMSGSINQTNNTALAIGYQQNGSTTYTLSLPSTSDRSNLSTLINAKAGDTLGLSYTSGGTPSLGTGNTNTWLAISLLQGPSNIAVLDSINARYYASSTSLSGSFATIVWTTKDYDSMNAMSGGTYTIPVSGKYFIKAVLGVSATYALNNRNDIQILKSGSIVSLNQHYIAGVISADTLEISDEINCLPGDTIQIQALSQGTGPAIVSSNTRNYFIIFRTGN